MNEEEMLQGDTFQLSEEERQRLLEEQAQVEADLAQAEQAAQTPAPAPTPETTVPAPVAAEQPLSTEQTTAQPETFDKSKDYSYYEAMGMSRNEWNRRQMSSGTGGELTGFVVDPKLSAEIFTAIPAGMADAVVDTVNFLVDPEGALPGPGLPKIPKYESEVVQSVRELSSIVIPNVGIIGNGTKALKVASKGSKFLSDPLVRKLGETAFAAGTGAFVDYVTEFNQTDDNAAGALKKSFPKWTGWIPDNIATLDSDSPDVKRMKNVNEGVYLGVGADLVMGLGKLAKGIKGMTDSYWVGESEKGMKFVKKNVVKEPDTAADVVEAASVGRQLEMDELGSYNLDKAGGDLNKPVYGVTDLYGYQEQAIRSVDNMGIVGASVDAVRIAKNYDSVYGRVGSVFSESALKFGLETSDNQNIIINGLASQLRDADKYGYKTASGTYISNDEIVKQGEDLASQFYNMDVGQIKEFLQTKGLTGIDPDTNIPVLKSEAYAGSMKAIKMYMDDFMNMDVVKAQAYTANSLAGQVSDTAQGMRLTEGTPSIIRAQEQILDRVEFLMAQKGMTSYTRGRALNMLNFWNRMTKKGSKAGEMAEAKRMKNLIKNEKNETLAAMERIKQESAETMDVIRNISEERPEMLAPLMLAYELTDGNVKTMHQVSIGGLQNSTGVLNKAFIDLEPEIPSLVLKGFWANLYNSTLGAFATPIKAGISNAYLLSEKPIRAFAGALAQTATTGDTTLLRRGWYQYSSMLETLQGSHKYSKQVFKRSALDPYVTEVRDDLGFKNEQAMELVNMYADAAAQRGEYGPQVMAQIINDQAALANHPWTRFGTRAMQAEDGFTQAMIAVSEAKGRAFDRVTEGGTKAFDAKKAEELYKEVYDGMFDETGLITDSAVKAAAGEIAMNLESAGNKALSGLITNMPMLKPFMLFTKTPINELVLSASYTPINPVQAFYKDFGEFGRRFEDTPTEKIKEIFAKRGITVDEFSAKNKYDELRADIIGRRAMGSIAVTSTVGLFMSDRITGDGLADRQKQKGRREYDWKPRSIKLPGGKWVSYDNLGAMSNWLALTVNVMDNFDSLEANDMSALLNKMSFVLGASVTKKSHLAGLEGLFEALSGDASAMAKHGASFLAAGTLTGSSQLAEISRLMEPGKKEVQMKLDQLIANRIPGLKETLPDKNDWIDGGQVGVPEDFLARMVNTYLPWKINGKISPEKQFLIDIEYDATPTLQTNGRGVDYTPEQKSDITNRMGEDKLFKDAIKSVMARTDARKFRNDYKKAVDAGMNPDLSTFGGVHRELDKQLRLAMDKAAAASPYVTEIQRKQMVQDTTEMYLQRGDQEGAKKFMDYMESKFSI